MSPRERKHRSYFVSGGSVEPRRIKSVVTEPALVVESAQEQCPHGLPLGKFCPHCADERSARNRIDVV